jgi:hypothetical protein
VLIMANKRVAVVVRGGSVIGVFTDEGVDARIFDWDEYNALAPDVAAKEGLPYAWRDIAKRAEVPFKSPSMEQYEELAGFIKVIAAQGTPQTVGLTVTDIVERARELVGEGL